MLFFPRFRLDPGFDRVAAAGETIQHMDYMRRVNERAQLGLHMALFHREFDVLLTPTLPITAFETGLLAPTADAAGTLALDPMAPRASDRAGWRKAWGTSSTIC